MNFKVILTVFFFLSWNFAQGKNQVLVLSGGGSPSGNHYSQYLQTKTIFEDLDRRLNDDVQLMFAAGHQSAQNARFADVHKTEKDAGIYSRFLVGAIGKNQPATKTQVQQYFNTQTRTPVENFFLIVSDHGMPNRVNDQSDATFSNNCIDLWNVRLQGEQLVDLGDFASGRCLSKNELAGHLNNDVQAQRKVFAMSQCFSGGFHQMSVQEKAGYPSAKPDLCGFTAVTHDTWASGCSPDVDGPSYQGYERSFTEQLTGYDYVNKKQLRPPRWSFLAAHEAAILEDMTVDIPLSTSEYYLWMWSKKMLQPHFVSRTQISFDASVQQKAENFQQASSNPEYLRKQKLYQKMIQAIQTKYPEEAADLDADMPQLIAKTADLQKQVDEIDQRMMDLDEQSMEVFDRIVRIKWLEQMTTGWGLPELEKQFENKIQQLNQSVGSGSAYYKGRVLPIIWKNDPDLARTQSRYLSKRSMVMIELAAKNSSFEEIAEIESMKAMDVVISQLSEDLDLLGKIHGLHRRVLIYRQVLGAWSALAQMKDSVALNELSGLQSCEKTALK